MANVHDDLELMQHADGELDEAADREVELRLGRDPEARGKVDAVGEVGELLRGHLELAADAVPDRRFELIWREIDKQIDLAAPAAAPAALIASERAASESIAMPIAGQASVWRRVTHWNSTAKGKFSTAGRDGRRSRRHGTWPHRRAPRGTSPRGARVARDAGRDRNRDEPARR